MLVIYIGGNRKIACKIDQVFPFYLHQVLIKFLRIGSGKAFYKINHLACAAQIEV